MGTLDSDLLIKALDSENMLQSIHDLPDQVEAAWIRSAEFALPTHYIQSQSVVILGLGASALAGYVAQAIGWRQSRIPIVVVEGGDLPAFVDSTTLVIGVSYSGKTNQTVSAFSAAGAQGAKLVGISTGGEIGALCRKYQAPLFSIQYGAQARAALGYLVIPVVAILHRLAILDIERMHDVIQTLISALKVVHDGLRSQVPTQQNRAKQLAEQLTGKLPMIVGSDYSWPTLRRWQAQFQQNAKTFAVAETVSSMLQSAIQGLSIPGNLQQQLQVVSIRSHFDTQADAERMNVLGTVLKRQRFLVSDVVLSAAADPLTECLELMLLGDYTSYYLALLNGVDPSATPNIMEIQEMLQRNTSMVR